jgi:hypothetical protein
MTSNSGKGMKWMDFLYEVNGFERLSDTHVG